MVKRLHIVLDDETFNKIKQVKQSLKLKWEEFLIIAAKLMENNPEKVEELKKQL